MNFSNENVYEAIIKIKDRHIEKLENWVLVLIFIASVSIGSVVAVNDHYKPQLTELKSELKIKNKQIDGLHKQLTRTQYQLKKAKKQLASDKWKINYENWEQIRLEVEKEEIDIDFVNSELDQLVLDHLENHLAGQLMLIQTFQADINYLGFISKAYDVLNKYELYYNFGISELTGNGG